MTGRELIRVDSRAHARLMRVVAQADDGVVFEYQHADGTWHEFDAYAPRSLIAQSLVQLHALVVGPPAPAPAPAQPTHTPRVLVEMHDGPASWRVVDHDDHEVAFEYLSKDAMGAPCWKYADPGPPTVARALRTLAARSQPCEASQPPALSSPSASEAGEADVEAVARRLHDIYERAAWVGADVDQLWTQNGDVERSWWRETAREAICLGARVPR